MVTPYDTLYTWSSAFLVETAIDYAFVIQIQVLDCGVQV